MIAHDSTRYYREPPDAFDPFPMLDAAPDDWNSPEMVIYALALRENGEIVDGGWYV